MKKQFLLSLLFCISVSLPGRSQLAAVIDSTVQRGTLFTNGTSLYEIYADTITSVNTATGSRTLPHKLPSFLPPGATTAKWGNRYNIKTANGFITTCDYNTAAASYKIWSYNGNSWDTILTPYYNWTPQSAPVQIGTNYTYCFTKPNGNTTAVAIVKTDGTNAGTQVLFQTDYPTNQLYVEFPLYANSTPALFAIFHLDGYSSTAKLRYKMGVADNAGARFIDSSNHTIYTMALLSNTLYYVNGLSGSPNCSYEVNAYNISTGARTNFISATPDLYSVGIGFKNKIIISRVPPPYNNTVQEKLISIDPATGVQKILADSLTYYAPKSNISEGVAGTNHLFIPFYPTTNTYTTMFNSRYLVTTDGITSGSKPRIYLSNALRFGLARSSFESSFGGVCQDELYFGSQYPGGYILDVRLYRLTGNNTLDSQLNCITPYSFVKVNGTMYLLARTLGNPANNSLWKITACTDPAGVANAPEASAQAALYPNPAHTTITVSLSGTVSAATLDLYDATGRRVLSQSVQSQQSVSTVHLPSGLYIYRITASNGVLLVANRLSIIH